MPQFFWEDCAVNFHVRCVQYDSSIRRQIAELEQALKIKSVEQDLCVALTGENLPPAERGVPSGGLGAPHGRTNVSGVRRSLAARSKAQAWP